MIELDCYSLHGFQGFTCTCVFMSVFVLPLGHDRHFVISSYELHPQSGCELGIGYNTSRPAWIT